MNTAQPAPEGALQPLWERALSDLERIAMQDYETMASGKKTLTAIRHLRFVLATLAPPDAALRARCERLEGALRQTIDRCARVELGAPSHCLANDLANVLRAVLAQLKEGAP